MKRAVAIWMLGLPLGLGLLGVTLYWLIKHYLPEHQRQHRAELDRILAAHEQSVFRLVTALERNTCVVQSPTSRF